MRRVTRFLRGFARHPARGIIEKDVSLEVGGREVLASFIRPLGTAPQPGWILLHGITVPGRHHPVLTRFAHALAASGAAVIIPDVPEWRALRVDPARGDVTIAAAAAFLASRRDLASNRLNLMGFSFGATQALISATRPGIRGAVRGVVGFGGYCDLGRTLAFMITGEHEWEGVVHRADPDPYGRWIVAANYLTDVPEYAHMHAVQDAILALALESGNRGVYAAARVYEPVKAALRAGLPGEQREIWDLLAPAFDAQPSPSQGRRLAENLLTAAMKRHPQLDPRPVLPELDQKLVLAHGREDRLIPFTETLRLRAALPADADVTISITRLFAHSRGAEGLRFLDYPREVGRYLALLNRALRPC